MASTTPKFWDDIETFGVQIVNADGTGFKTLFAVTEDCKIEAIGATTDDTANIDLQLTIQKGGVDYPVNTKRIPIGAGTTGGATAVAGVDMLDGVVCPFLRRDENGNPYLLLDTGCTLRVKAMTAVTAAKTLSVFGQRRK